MPGFGLLDSMGVPVRISTLIGLVGGTGGGGLDWGIEKEEEAEEGDVEFDEDALRFL
jgi:hypothetical protein